MKFILFVIAALSSIVYGSLSSFGNANNDDMEITSNGSFSSNPNILNSKTLTKFNILNNFGLPRNNKVPLEVIKAKVTNQDPVKHIESIVQGKQASPLSKVKDAIGKFYEETPSFVMPLTPPYDAIREQFQGINNSIDAPKAYLGINGPPLDSFADLIGRELID